MHNHCKNVLLVGGAGYVGGAVTDLLMETEHNVRVYDALLYEESYRKPVEFVFGDVRDRGLLREQLKWADVVVWLAALVGDGACELHPRVTVHINQESVWWMSENFDGRILFLSTCSVYGAQNGLLYESSPTLPLSLYAETKLGAECHLAKKNAIIFRLGTLFGVGDLFARVRLDLVLNVLTAKAYGSRSTAETSFDLCSTFATPPGPLWRTLPPATAGFSIWEQRTSALSIWPSACAITSRTS